MTISLQSLIVAAGSLVTSLNFVRENLQLLAQNRRLDRIEARGEPNAHVVVLVRALPVHPQASERVGKGIIVGDDGAAIAIAAEWLGGEKTGRCRVAESAEPAIVENSSEALRGIVQHQKVFGLC